MEATGASSHLIPIESISRVNALSQQGRHQLGAAPWSSPAREWAGAAPFDDGVYIALAPDNIDVHLAELARTSGRTNVFRGHGIRLRTLRFAPRSRVRTVSIRAMRHRLMAISGSSLKAGLPVQRMTHRDDRR